MYKNIIISVLTAELLIKHPWYAGCTLSERIALIMGTATVVFIFLLFLEDLWKKIQKCIRKVRRYRMRVRRLRNTIKKLREGGDHGRFKGYYYVGSDTGADDKKRETAHCG